MYLTLLLKSKKISIRDEIEIQCELSMLQKKRHEEVLAAFQKDGISLYGSYFSSDIKID